MESFKELGLSKYEDAIYSALLGLGSADAKTISKKSNVPPTAVYPNLRKLQEKQLINELKGNISYFTPVNPSIAIKNLIKERENRLNDLKEKAISEANELRRNKFPVENEILSVTHGKDMSKEIYLNAIDKTRKSFYILGWRLRKIDDKYNLIKYFRKMSRKGIDIRFILTGDLEKQEELIRDYIEAGVKIRYSPLDNFSIFIRDSEECKITLKDKEYSKRFNLHFNEKNLAKAMNFYFLDIWEKSEDLW